jgi:iron(III) transport system permease protein
MATLCLTLAAPGSVAGMALKLAYLNVPQIYDSAVMIVMAQAVRSMPYVILVLWPYVRVMPQEYFEAAAVDGLDRPRQFMRVVVPLCRRPIIAAWAIDRSLRRGQSLSRSAWASSLQPTSRRRP